MENLRVIYDVMKFTEEQKIPGLIMLIDFEKPLILCLGTSYTNA